MRVYTQLGVCGIYMSGIAVNRSCQREELMWLEWEGRVGGIVYVALESV